MTDPQKRGPTSDRNTWHNTPPPDLELSHCPHCGQQGFVTYPGRRHAYDSGDHQYCFACGYSHTDPY